MEIYTLKVIFGSIFFMALMIFALSGNFFYWIIKIIVILFYLLALPVGYMLYEMYQEEIREIRENFFK